MNPTRASKIKGCLLGGAAGDALGAPVEFLDIRQIHHRFATPGITELIPPGHFTDDTQMTLFTLEGLIRAHERARANLPRNTELTVFRAYQRWLYTQGTLIDMATDGWLVEQPSLFRREAPGTTCLTSLESGIVGTIDFPLNNSKGCGTVMRMAPVGLLGHGISLEQTYRLGCRLGALTHGHPDAQHAAGAFAALISSLLQDSTLPAAVSAILPLASKPIAQSIGEAVTLSLSGLPSPKTIESRLGGGWVADEALAIALCCALAAPDLESGLIAAANHSGDTDSTAAICGNLLGTLHGYTAIPPRWLEQLDSADIVDQAAQDVIMELLILKGDALPPSNWSERYPRW